MTQLTDPRVIETVLGSAPLEHPITDQHFLQKHLGLSYSVCWEQSGKLYIVGLCIQHIPEIYCFGAPYF